MELANPYNIQSIPLFSSLAAAQLGHLNEAASRRLYRAGETVFSHGELPEYLYVVEHGTIDIVLPAQGGDIIVATFEPGSFFGELAVFDRQPRTATARAAMDSSLICVPLPAVAEVLDQHAGAARHFISVVIHRLRGADELLSRLQIKNVNELVEQRMTFGERIADLVAHFGGSWPFILSFFAFLIAWTIVNSALMLKQPPDPYPYIFLNLLLSCLAALQAPIIMMSQNRQAAKDRLQADEDFRVNVKAEFAIQQLHRKLDELRAAMLQHRRPTQT
jgi:CRP/FNR family transcriptional regulator, cyclic AMP receptor protein